MVSQLDAKVGFQLLALFTARVEIGLIGEVAAAATFLRLIHGHICPPQQFLGWEINGAMWGYFLGNTGKCQPYGWPEACYNWVVYIPILFGNTSNPGGGNGGGGKPR